MPQSDARLPETQPAAMTLIQAQQLAAPPQAQFRDVIDFPNRFEIRDERH